MHPPFLSLSSSSTAVYAKTPLFRVSWALNVTLFQKPLLFYRLKGSISRHWTLGSKKEGSVRMPNTLSELIKPLTPRQFFDAHFSRKPLPIRGLLDLSGPLADLLAPNAVSQLAEDPQTLSRMRIYPAGAGKGFWNDQCSNCHWRLWRRSRHLFPKYQPNSRRSCHIFFVVALLRCASSNSSLIKSPASVVVTMRFFKNAFVN